DGHSFLRLLARSAKRTRRRLRAAKLGALPVSKSPRHRRTPRPTRLGSPRSIPRNTSEQSNEEDAHGRFGRAIPLKQKWTRSVRRLPAKSRSTSVTPPTRGCAAGFENS